MTYLGTFTLGRWLVRLSIDGPVAVHERIDPEGVQDVVHDVLEVEYGDPVALAVVSVLRIAEIYSLGPPVLVHAGLLADPQYAGVLHGMYDMVLHPTPATVQ